MNQSILVLQNRAISCLLTGASVDFVETELTKSNPSVPLNNDFVEEEEE